jgi:hypothetical protein
MYLDDSDLYYRLLGARLRSLLKLSGPLRISAISALKGILNAEGRRDTQRAAEITN